MRYSFLSTRINCCASSLAWGLLGVLWSCLKPGYVLKFRKSCPLNGGPLSLPTISGIPSEENMRSSFGSTAQALVVLSNSTSTHRECWHMTTRRYSPVLIGLQKSMATFFQGWLRSGDIRSGSRSFAGVTTWHGWQCWMWASTIRSKPGNQTLVLRYSFVFVTPWCRSWASRTTKWPGYHYARPSHHQSSYHC